MPALELIQASWSAYKAAGSSKSVIMLLNRTHSFVFWLFCAFTVEHPVEKTQKIKTTEKNLIITPN